MPWDAAYIPPANRIISVQRSLRRLRKQRDGSKHGWSLQTYAEDGTHISDVNYGLETPSVVALRGDGTAWVFLSDTDLIVCVQLQEISPDAESKDLDEEIEVIIL